MRNDISDDAKEAIIKKLQDAVINRGGEILNVDKWGVKQFAYLIDDRRDGYYFLMNVLASADTPAEIERQIKITPEAVRAMILKKDE